MCHNLLHIADFVLDAHCIYHATFINYFTVATD